MVRKTMELINENTCVKFIPSIHREHALYITGRGGGFHAVPGRTIIPRHQMATLDPEFGEEDRATIAHELFHVLGRSMSISEKTETTILLSCLASVCD
uniref:Peptidase M12A domain-containing protein n=1 Tax=Ditylenchus dipsaci TaxID=166011 RepID=A0A915CV64_9BILA